MAVMRRGINTAAREANNEDAVSADYLRRKPGILLHGLD
jgi:hypothetical protein